MMMKRLLLLLLLLLKKKMMKMRMKVIMIMAHDPVGGPVALDSESRIAQQRLMPLGP